MGKSLTFKGVWQLGESLVEKESAVGSGHRETGDRPFRKKRRPGIARGPSVAKASVLFTKKPK